MNAQLADLRDHLRSNAKRAQSLVTRAGDRLAVRLKPDSWSAAECLVHLTLSTESFFPAWPAALAKARAKCLTDGGTRPFRMDLAGGMLNWVLQPTRKIRNKAPAILQPSASGDVLAEFLRTQDRLLELVLESDGLALDRIKIPSPVNARLRYSVWSSFRITDTHQRRHLLQAERAAGLGE